MKQQVFKKNKLLILIALSLINIIAITGCGISKDNVNNLVDIIMNNDKNNESLARSTPLTDKINVSYYIYERITDDEKKIYDEIYNAVNLYDSHALLSTTDIDYAKKIYSYVLADHPELFWVDGISFETVTKGSLVKMYFKPDFIFTEEEITSYNTIINDYFNECMSQAVERDAYSLSKYFYEYIIKNTAYNENVQYDQTIISAIDSKASVCAGYARLYQYLLQRNGIQCAVVTGFANNTNHAWNLVNINGAYYYTDTTWGDMDYTGENTLSDIINYSYLNLTTEEISKTHSFDNNFILEECSAINDNFYVKESLYLYEYDKNDIKQILSSNKTQGYAAIKCADKKIYDKLCDYLIEDGNIMSFTNNKSKIQYIVDDNLYILTFET